jgi:hypothetical protein
VTISSSGRVTGTATKKKGSADSAVNQDAAPVACTGEPAATMAMRRPPGGVPVARSRATRPRESEPKNWRQARGSSTKTPRGPELPPEVSTSAE